jgi:hypothetical protein
LIGHQLFPVTNSDETAALHTPDLHRMHIGDLAAADDSGADLVQAAALL